MRIKRVCSPEIKAPEFHHVGDAGYDLRSTIDTDIYPHENVMIPTGFVWEIPTGFCGFVKSRSGLATREDILSFHGLIDSSYRGELVIQIRNVGTRPYVVGVNDRIAQLVVVPYAQFDIQEVTELGDTPRGLNGFGSSGVK